VVQFLNWVRLVILVFLTSVTLDPIFLTTDGHGRRATEWVVRANWGRRHAVLPIWFMGIFRRGRGGDGHDRSFITREFNRGWGKENGTIPF
jgi:hypothetical protein